MRKFEYVPAAITGRPANTFCGIKLEDNSGSSSLWKRTRFNGITTHWLPDRTVYFGGSNTLTSGILDVDFDTFFIMSPSTHPEVLKSAGFNYAMASPLHTSKSAETRRNKLVKLFCDSGGFQLVSGASDFIDMDELADIYNRVTDYGIGLDIPVRSGLQSKYLMRMASVMLDNNRYLRSKVIDKVEIYDVSHGNILPHRKEFLEAVIKDKVKEKREGGGLAVGGIMQNSMDGGASKTIVTGTVNLVYTILSSKGYYERYHILGTTNSFFQFLYHIILYHGGAPHITADSTSYVLPSANNLFVEVKAEANHSLTSYSIQKSHHSYLSRCCCPICANIKYMREFHVNYLANALHCLYALSNQRDRIEETAMDYIQGKVTLNDALIAVTGQTNNAKLRVFIEAVRFAEEACTKGFAKAWADHREKLKSVLRDGIKTSTLFDSSSEDPTDAERRLVSILSRYEAFHKKRKS